MSLSVHSRRGLALSSLLVALGTLAPALAADRAVLVGVDIYNEDGSFGHLPGAGGDVATMQSLARETLGFANHEIRLLRGPQASRAAILSAFDWLVEGTNPGDRALFYFSGHGMPAQDLNGDEDDGLDEAIAPADVRLVERSEAGNGTLVYLPESIGDVAPSSIYLENLIRDDEIHAQLERLPGRRVMVILDSCFSGTGSKSAVLQTPEGGGIKSPLGARNWVVPASHQTSRGQLFLPVEDNPQALTDGASAASVVTWSAAGPYQFAWELQDSSNGVFTRALADGLQGHRADANGDEQITNAELLRFVQDRSAAFCRQSTSCIARNGGRLDPRFEGPASLLAADAISGRPIAVAGAGLFLPPSGPEAAAAPKVEILAQDGQYVGRPVRFHIEAGGPGRLTLIDIDPEQRVYQLFPNFRSRALGIDPVLRAGVPVTVPSADYGFEFRPNKPGRGKLIAIVSEERLDLSDLTDGNLQLAVADGNEFLVELASRLRSSWREEIGSRATRWSAAEIDYVVQP